MTTKEERGQSAKEAQAEEPRAAETPKTRADRKRALTSEEVGEYERQTRRRLIVGSSPQQGKD